MKSSILGLAFVSLALGFASALSSCGGAERESVGKVDLALTGTSASGKRYRLRNGVIEITGPTVATVDTEDDPDAAAVELELKAGAYTAALGDGWILERALQGTSTFEAVEAVLVSANPLPFTIEEELTTHVRLLFNAGEPVELEHNGRAVVEIGVDDCSGAGAADCDLDSDGFPGATDCDDSDPSTYPGAYDYCDGRDNNCDGQVDEWFACDFDFDGFPWGVDCNDNDFLTWPGAPELCDFRDNSCDGQIDENCSCPSDPGPLHIYECDYDGDGYAADDCDPFWALVNPGATDVCDHFDNNCDGQVDENNVCGCLGEPTCDFDGDGFPGSTDCNDLDSSINPGAEEVCGDGTDNDCDGSSAFCDNDGDGFLSPDDCYDYDPSRFPGAPERCDLQDDNCNNQIDENLDDCDYDGDGFFNSTDCFDNHEYIYPGAPEVCDLADNDCDGLVDEDIICCWPGDPSCDFDLDGDGARASVDCDDTDPSISYFAPEVCDGKDNNCDDQVDENGVCGGL